MNGTDDRTQSGSSRHIVHAPLVQATETDRSRVKGSLQSHSIRTRTYITQCSASDSAGKCWLVKGGKTRVRMGDTD